MSEVERQVKRASFGYGMVAAAGPAAVALHGGAVGLAEIAIGGLGIVGVALAYRNDIAVRSEGDA